VTAVIGVDVGGTKVAAGVVDEHGGLTALTRRDTPSADPSATAQVIADLVVDLCRSHDATAVGIGAPGLVGADRSTVVHTPNLAWRDYPLRTTIERHAGLPVVVENDANAAAWAEARFGAGRGQRCSVVLTVGTGLGGGLVIDGGLHRGHLGMAGELGHMIVEVGGRPCGCGNRGCWEQYASGQALVRAAQDGARNAPAAARRLLTLAAGSVDGITGRRVMRAAQAGDEVAREAFGALGTWLGTGMASLANILDPGVFVIGGGVCAAGELLREPAVLALEENLVGWRRTAIPDVQLARFGPEAGIIGAADLVRHR
jgi:glucokinase